MRKVMSKFTIRQKLLLCGSVLFAALFVAGSYYGSRWLHGPDVEPLPEHLLSDRPHGVSMNRPVRASGSQYAPSVSETDMVSDGGLSGDVVSTSDSDEIENAERNELVEERSALEQGEGKDFPEVPEGFPVTPVWLKDYFHERDFSNHVRLYRVLIELWIRGDRDFISGFSESKTGKVYPIYPDVVYLKWASYVREGPAGQSVEVPYIKRRLGATDTVNQLVDSDGQLFTEQEILSGAYKTKFPGINFVDYDDAGFNPATVLNDYRTYAIFI